ncbi:MAG: sugar ABC transporter permease [Thermodesulfobacteriota bacterium]
MRQGSRAEKTAWLMAAPGLTGLLLFIALPAALALILSFTSFRLGSPLAPHFVGLSQFQRIFSDGTFSRALANNGLFALLVVPLQTGLALALALLVNRRLPGITFFRACFFLPVIFPMALVAVVWKLILAPGEAGLLNTLLHTMSLGAWQPVDFLHHPRYAMGSIMLLSIWQGAGFQMIILLAGLQAIPQSLYEAAALDGAGPWQRFWYITLPQLKNALIFVALITTILAFRLFDQVWILTQGGPHQATSTVIFETVRAVFRRQDVAKGAAMSVIFFAIVLLITMLQQRLSRQGREEQ